MGSMVGRPISFESVFFLSHRELRPLESLLSAFPEFCFLYDGSCGFTDTLCIFWIQPGPSLACLFTFAYSSSKEVFHLVVVI